MSDSLRDKAFDFCTERDWKLSSNDTGTKNPEFAELKKYILSKALSATKKVVYNKERAIKGYEELKESAAAIVQPPPTPTVSPTSTLTHTPNSDPSVAELTKQIASLTLMMQAHMNPPNSSEQAKPMTARTTDLILHCIWCDSTNHIHQPDCSELDEALKKGLVAINIRNRIINAITKEEIPPMFGRGGMKKVFEATTTTPAVAVTNAITLEEPTYGALGPEVSIHVTTFDFDNGTRTDKIIDVDIRKRDDIMKQCMRPRLDGNHVIPSHLHLPMIPIRRQTLHPLTHRALHRPKYPRENRKGKEDSGLHQNSIEQSTLLQSVRRL